jgi:hypothetical protein
MIFSNSFCDVMRNKKVTGLFIHQFFVRWNLYTGLSHYGVAHSGGGKGTAEAHGSVITLEWKINFMRIFLKNQGLK